ncbi:MAG: Spy/CpxP family protein refolding chaperone [Deltaproteobacteria bacterium]|nr:Spy/CpxP family protein refolding chaperone [Deltaproteobacteria bacterium]
MFGLRMYGLCFIAAALLVSNAGAEDRLLYGSTFCMVPRCDELSPENHLYIMNADKLGLSDEQIKKLRQIKSECDREFIEDRARMRVARTELYTLLEADPVDMKAVEEKSEEISRLLNGIILKRTKVKVKSMMILTEEQKKKARGLFSRR